MDKGLGQKIPHPADLPAGCERGQLRRTAVRNDRRSKKQLRLQRAGRLPGIEGYSGRRLEEPETAGKGVRQPERSDNGGAGAPEIKKMHRAAVHLFGGLSGTTDAGSL